MSKLPAVKVKWMAEEVSFFNELRLDRGSNLLYKLTHIIIREVIFFQKLTNSSKRTEI